MAGYTGGVQQYDSNSYGGQQTPQGGYGLMNTAQGLMDRPYGGINPMGPAGITDLQRQGQMTQLQGMGSQYAPAQQYAQQMGQYSNNAQNFFNQGMQSGQFGWNPQMQASMGMANQAAQGNPYGGMASQAAMRGMNPQGFNQSNQMMAGAPNQRGFDQAAQGVGNTMSQYGGGYSNAMADRINQTGASFNPWNDKLEGAIGSANKQLGRDFNQTVMPEMNKQMIGSGSGAYGGTRAGVAQGLREQGLADAMQKQTTDMSSAGYEAGLGRYVQDRGNTLNATNQAMQTGGQLGIQGSQLLGNLANQRGQLQLSAGQGIGQNAYQQGGLMGNAAQGLGQNAYQQGGLMGNAAQGLGQNANNLGGLNMQGGQLFSNLSSQQRNAQIQAAQQIGLLGQNSLNQQNQMSQWGFGTMMPNAINQSYQAALQPGQIQQGMGQAMQGFGQGQQQQNQRVQDWYNGQYNAAQNYPDQRFNNYVNQTGQFLTAGGQTPVQQPGRNPYADAVGAGSAGYGMYNAWNQNQPNQMTQQQQMLQNQWPTQ